MSRHTLDVEFIRFVSQDIAETYRFICDNYRPYDELFLIGFSRGAFTARSIAGMVCSLGFLNRAGIEQLPHIFGDYSHWSSWTSESHFNHQLHLRAFTLENMEKNEEIDVLWKNIKAKQKVKEGHSQESGVPGPSSTRSSLEQNDARAEFEPTYTPRSKSQLKVELQKDKEALFQNIVKANRTSGTDEAAQVAKVYRDMLAKVGNSRLCRPPRSPPFIGLICWQHQLVMTSKRRSESPEPKPGDSAKSGMNSQHSVAENVDQPGAAGGPKKGNGNELEEFPMEGRVRAIGEFIRESAGISD